MQSLPSLAFDYGTVPIRGVSTSTICSQSPLRGADACRVDLGGWLVSEPFIKPSLYEAANKANGLIVDEVRSFLARPSCRR